MQAWHLFAGIFGAIGPAADADGAFRPVFGGGFLALGAAMGLRLRSVARAEATAPDAESPG